MVHKHSVASIAALSLVVAAGGNCQGDAPHPKTLERTRVGSACILVVEVDSKVASPCRFMANFDKDSSCSLRQVQIGTSKSIANYFRGPFTSDAGVEWQWNERERIRLEPVSGTIGLLISTPLDRSCGFAYSLSSPHIGVPLTFTQILGSSSAAAANAVQLRFMVAPHNNPPNSPTLELYTTVDKSISMADAGRLTEQVAEHLGLKEGVSVFFNRQPVYFDGGYFPLFNPLFDQGTVSLDDAKASRFVACSLRGSGVSCGGALTRD
jgi:hypothetical protein